MKFDGAMKHFLVAFLIAVVGYFVLFSAIERHRVADGPWQLSFAINAAGNPTIKVDQQRIGIYDVKFWFVSTNVFPVSFRIVRAPPVRASAAIRVSS